MYDGFIRVAAVSPGVKTADVKYNANEIIKRSLESYKCGAKVIVFPELCLTGADCRDLFLQSTLLQAAEDALLDIAEHLKDMDAIIFVGLPMADHGSIYNAVAAISKGCVLGIVPKNRIGNDAHSQGRPFVAAKPQNRPIAIGEGQNVIFGSNQLFACESMPELVIGVEVGEDFLLADEPATNLALHGASIIVVPSAVPESVTSRIQRRANLLVQSNKLHTAYVYAGASKYESTTDTVCSGARLIVEDGQLLGEDKLYTEGMLLSEIDVNALRQQRLSDSLFVPMDDAYEINVFSLDIEPALKDRKYDPLPFVPSDEADVAQYCEDVFNIQVHGLMQRMNHANIKKAIVGVSGGLDSTLALLVSARALDLMGRPRTDLLAVTMPGFGTTDRTYENAVAMIKAIGAEFREISIKDAVSVHFKDIGHDEKTFDAAYENAQARERTQILMDIANMNGGLVVGTGDLSELALGWATYNGDHMSMYAVNGAVTKTLIRYVIHYYMDTFVSDDGLKAILQDVIDTPISPELVPSDTGEISQKTEEKVGPYELSDFYLYYHLGYGFMPEKILRLANNAFEGIYTPEEIAKWLDVFYARFFSQQYKRSCLPDGPGIGLVGVSPRGGLRMPSDASSDLWKNWRV